MKRLLEWKQRMLQSPLTRKSTPATISLARSLNHSRQSLRSDQYNKPKTYTNASYNSYSSDDEGMWLTIKFTLFAVFVGSYNVIAWFTNC